MSRVRISSPALPRHKGQGATPRDKESHFQSYATFLQKQGRLAEAETLAREQMLNDDAILGARSPHGNRTYTRGVLKEILLAQHKDGEAAKVQVEIDEIKKLAASPTQANSIQCLLANAGKHLAEDRLDDARAGYMNALDSLTRAFGKDNIQRITCLRGLAMVETKRERHTEAEKLLREALEAARRNKAGLPEAQVTVDLFATLRQQKRHAKGGNLWEQCQSLLHNETVPALLRAHVMQQAQSLPAARHGGPGCRTEEADCRDGPADPIPAKAGQVTWAAKPRTCQRRGLLLRCGAGFGHKGRMHYRRFGRTNLQMPVFSCGGMRYQQSWDDLAPEAVAEAGQRNLEATILRSLELGINHIETARGYGSSEMQLGWILPRLPREKMIVQTKVAPFATAREFRETFERSMAYLKLEHVDLLTLHGVNNAELLEWSLRKGGCLEEARKLQREGRCRFVGFTTHAPTDLILRAIETAEFDYVNLHWYFVNELNWAAVEAAARRDMGVFIISPNDKGGKLYAPPPRLTELCAPLSPMQWNDLWCLARPEVHTLSLGAAKPSDFEEHIAGLAHYDRAAEITAPIEERLRAAMREALGAEWCARWSEGLPNYTDVPGEVNVQEIVRLFTYARGLDLTDWGKMRYNLMGNAGHWFPGANAGSFDAEGVRAACAGSPFAERIPQVLAEAHALLHDAPKKRLSEGG